MPVAPIVNDKVTDMETSQNTPMRPPRRPSHRVRTSRWISHQPRRTHIINVVRRDLAIAVFILVGLAGVSALLLPNGMPIFDKLLPMLTFVLGYFFHHQ